MFYHEKITSAEKESQRLYFQGVPHISPNAFPPATPNGWINAMCKVLWHHAMTWRRLTDDGPSAQDTDVTYTRHFFTEIPLRSLFSRTPGWDKTSQPLSLDSNITEPDCLGWPVTQKFPPPCCCLASFSNDKPIFTISVTRLRIRWFAWRLPNLTV